MQDGPAYKHLSYVIDACLTAIFKNNLGKVDTIPEFIGAKDNGSGGVVGFAISQFITTNKPTSNIFAGWMTLLSPNQQCQST